MHSVIMQVGERPIREDCWITESDYLDNGFVGSVADYVRTYSKEERAEFLKNIGDFKIFRLDGDCIVIKNRESYFKEKYEKFSNAVSDLADVSYGTFSNADNHVYSKIFELTSSYNDKYDMYIRDDGGTQTLDHWMRKVKNGDRFYIGGVLDYHF